MGFLLLVEQLKTTNLCNLTLKISPFTSPQVHCIQRVIKESMSGEPEMTWTCTDNDCSNCEGNLCSSFTLTVSIEGAATDLTSISDCRYGDTVKLEKNDGANLYVYEIAIIENTGKKYGDTLFYL